MEKNVKPEQSISKTVNDLLNSKPFIQELFKIDAVNYSGLARYLTPEVEKRLDKESVNTEAVIMAVKRFGDSAKSVELEENIRMVLSECSLFARNDLRGFTLRKSKRIYEVISELQHTLDYVRGDVLYVLQSASEIELITERKVAKEFLNRIDESDILHKAPKLALIGVKKPEIAIEIPGIIFCLSKILAMHGISVIDMTNTYVELTFVVHEENAPMAYTLLDSEIKKYRRS